MISAAEQALIDKLNGYENRISSLERGTQYQSAQWSDIPLKIIVSASNVIHFDDNRINPRSYFNVGDKIRILHTGEYRYGYVKEINSSDEIGVICVTSANVPYSISVADITVSRSFSENPPGHPDVIKVNLAVTPLSGTYAAGPLESGRFKMLGNLCYFKVDVQGTLSATVASALVDLPVPLSAQVYTGMNFRYGTYFDGMMGIAFNSSSQLLIRPFNPASGYGSFANGTNFFIISFDILYPCVPAATAVGTYGISLEL